MLARIITYTARLGIRCTLCYDALGAGRLILQTSPLSPAAIYRHSTVAAWREIIKLCPSHIHLSSSNRVDLLAARRVAS